MGEVDVWTAFSQTIISFNLKKNKKKYCMYAQILNQAIFEFNIHVVHRNSKMKQASEFHLLPIFQFNTTVNI